MVLTAYGAENFTFGPDTSSRSPSIHGSSRSSRPPSPRPRWTSGVATRPIADFDAYTERLTDFVYRTGLPMKPVFDAAKRAPRRVIFAEGERVKVLQAAHQVVTEGIARPILVGNRRFIEERLINVSPAHQSGAGCRGLRSKRGRPRTRGVVGSIITS